MFTTDWGHQVGSIMWHTYNQQDSVTFDFRLLACLSFGTDGFLSFIVAVCVFNISLQSINQDFIVLSCIFAVIWSLCGVFDVNNNSSCCDLPKARPDTDFNEQDLIILTIASTLMRISTLVTLPPTWQLNLIVSTHVDRWDSRFMSVRPYRSSQRAYKASARLCESNISSSKTETFRNTMRTCTS